jgi:dihydrofolate reductase
VTSDGKKPLEARADSRFTIHDSRLSIIVAMAKNRVIGAGNAIPWRLPEELKYFKRVTMGHHMIMGRKTWESIGRPLPGRTTVIVTRQRDYQAQGVRVTHSLDQAIAACGDDDEIFVIGGAELYVQALPRAGRIYLTTVDAEIEGDTVMPDFDTAKWREVASEAFSANDRHAYSFCCAILERVHP